MAYDWLTSTGAARRELYFACKRVVDGHYVGHWQHFIDAVFPGSANLGIGFQDNFRAGRIGRAKATALARWLSVHQTHEAERLAHRVRELADREPATWETFVREHAAHDLAVIRLHEIGIVGFASSSQAGIPRFRFGEEFCLRIDCPFDGQALALQRTRGRWHRLPLSDTSSDATVAKGMATLPRSDATGEIIPLCDHEDGGRILFVVILADADVIAPSTAMPPDDHDMAPAMLNRIATRLLNAPRFAAFQTEILIS